MPSKVADLTVDELREVLRATIRDLIEEIVVEKLETLLDPDDGLELEPDVADSLREYLRSNRRGDPAEEVWHSLGLD